MKRAITDRRQGQRGARSATFARARRQTDFCRGLATAYCVKTRARRSEAGLRGVFARDARARRRSSAGRRGGARREMARAGAKKFSGGEDFQNRRRFAGERFFAPQRNMRSPRDGAVIGAEGRADADRPSKSRRSRRPRGFLTDPWAAWCGRRNMWSMSATPSFREKPTSSPKAFTVRTGKVRNGRGGRRRARFARKIRFLMWVHAQCRFRSVASVDLSPPSEEVERRYYVTKRRDSVGSAEPKLPDVSGVGAT